MFTFARSSPKMAIIHFFPSRTTCSYTQREMESIPPPLDPGLALWLVSTNFPCIGNYDLLFLGPFFKRPTCFPLTRSQWQRTNTCKPPCCEEAQVSHVEKNGGMQLTAQIKSSEIRLQWKHPSWLPAIWTIRLRPQVWWSWESCPCYALFKFLTSRIMRK